MAKQLQDYEADEIYDLLINLQNRVDAEGEEELSEKIESVLPLVDTGTNEENI